MSKNAPLEGSESHLLDLEMAWKDQVFRCPECNRKLKFETLRLLEDNECPHCHKTIFVPGKLDEYFLYQFSGGGGMGSVYKAVSRKFPRRVLAVKILSRKNHDTPENIRGLLVEAEVGEHFKDSEFLAAIVDHGYANGEFYTVMPYVEGEGLDKRIDRLHQLPPAEVLPMLLHLLAAEQHIYRKGFLFRDMKPENIIINQYGYAVLLDFGLCITLDEARNPTSEFISGSPYYMPPERLLGTPEDAYSEIYSMGMVAFHALTGHTLYDANGLEELAHKHVAKIKVSASAKMEGIPEDISAVLQKMIKSDPAERYQTFQEVYQEIQRLMNRK